MTDWRWKWAWLTAMLALVLAWGVPAEARARGKRDEALDARVKAASQAEYRVIVETVDHSALTGDKALKLAGGKKLRRLVSFPGEVAVVTPGQLRKLEQDPLVKAVYLDRGTTSLADRTGTTTGATYARASLGLTGRGIGVAVIDSGITGWHDDLTDRGVGQRVSAFVDLVGGQTAAYDDYGHGTHVAGIIAGNGYDSYGRYAGVAPGTNLVALKVLNGQGGGFMSDVIAAIDWTIANRQQYGLRVINLSVGAPVTSSFKTDPLAHAARRAVEAGLVVVTAAGNRGRNDSGQIQYGGITAPGNSPYVITVGNLNTQGTVRRWDDVVAASSSRGPTAFDYLAKPDLVAPGTGIVSLNAAGSTLSAQHPEALVNGSRGVAPAYLSLSGSSMAAPVVAGTVALMLEANPSLTPNLVKAILQYTSEWRTGVHPLAQGAGLLNSFGAITLARKFANPTATTPNASMWSRHLIWGNYMVAGGELDPAANAWALNIVWGTLSADGDNIVWGTLSGGGDNIVWGTLSADGDNIVWGTLAIDGDNIVWGTLAIDGDNIVWGTDCGGNDCRDVVWGSVSEGDNIVWGTIDTGDNIVWGTMVDGDNIVWGTADGDNIVWGTAADGDNIVWGTTADGDNIVWGTGGALVISGTEETAGAMFDDLFVAPLPVVTDGTIGGIL